MVRIALTWVHVCVGLVLPERWNEVTSQAEIPSWPQSVGTKSQRTKWAGHGKGKLLRGY